MARLAADPALRARMGEAARARFENEFRADITIDRIDSIYRRVQAGPRDS